MIRANNNMIVETKVTYTTQQGGIDYNGSIYNMAGAWTRGDGAVDQYTGNLVKPKQLTIRGTWSTTQSHSALRLVVFQWADSTIPAPSGILNYIGGVLAPESGLYWTNVHKIHVLYDEKTVLFPVAGSTAAGQFFCNITAGFKPIQVAVTSNLPQMNGLFVVAVSDDAIPAYPQLYFVSELRFTDA